MTRGGSVVLLTLGAVLLHAGAMFSLGVRRTDLLSVLAPLVMLAFAATLVGATLGHASGEHYGRIGGIESTRGKIAWALVALAAALMFVLVLRGDAPRSVSWAETGWAMPIVGATLVSAIVPLAWVPVLLVDPNVTVGAAMTISIARTMRTSLRDMLVGPVRLVLALPVPLAILFAIGRDIEALGCLLTLFLYVGMMAAAASQAIAGVVDIARRATRMTSLGDRPTIVGVLAVFGPPVLALAAIVTLARAPRPTSPFFPVVVPESLMSLVIVVASLVVLVAAWAAIEAVRRRGTTGRASAAPTLVSLRAADVEVDPRGHRLRRGAELTLTDGARLAAPALVIAGFAIDTEPEAVLEAWVDAPPKGEATYRAAPAAFSEDAVVHIGAPSATDERRRIQALARSVTPLAVGTTALVVAGGMLFATFPRALALVVHLWSG